MRQLFKYVLPLALLIGAVQSAQAQMGFGRQWETNVDLMQSDIDMIKGRLAQSIHGKQAGTSASWSNPATGNSGTLTLQRVFERQGRRCEQIDYQIRSSAAGNPADRYDLVSCLVSDGTWKLAY